MVEKAHKKYDVKCVVVEELATGGELFYYVLNSGAFSQKVAIYYFGQLLEGLQYMHNSGIAHRDLKPDNVLFSEDFTLKIADFGFAGPLAGRDGSGYMRTILGTKPYMAPELNERKPYIGTKVDVFAAAVILFIMVSGTPPFNYAAKDEFYYKFLYYKKFELFWKYHSKGKPAGENFFSPEFKDLMQRLLAYNPDERLSIEEIYQHPWMNLLSATQAEIHSEFLVRKSINDDKLKEE